MRLEVGGIDHHLAILSRCFCQFGKNIVEDAHLAPAQKTIVERFSAKNDCRAFYTGHTRAARLSTAGHV